MKILLIALSLAAFNLHANDYLICPNKVESDVCIWTKSTPFMSAMIECSKRPYMASPTTYGLLPRLLNLLNEGYQYQGDHTLIRTESSQKKSYSVLCLIKKEKTLTFPSVTCSDDSQKVYNSNTETLKEVNRMLSDGYISLGDGLYVR